MEAKEIEKKYLEEQQKVRRLREIVKVVASQLNKVIREIK